MAPKKSNKSGKKGKVTNPDEEAKDQMWDQALALREELEQMKKQKNQFQHERDNCMLSWNKDKRRLELQSSIFNQRLVVKEEREKLLQDQIKVDCEQMKHVQQEHHDAASELKIETAASERHMMNQNTKSELELRYMKMVTEFAALEMIENNWELYQDFMLKKEEEKIECMLEFDFIHKQIQESNEEKSAQIVKEHLEELNHAKSQNMEELDATAKFQPCRVQQKWRGMRNLADKLEVDGDPPSKDSSED